MLPILTHLEPRNSWIARVILWDSVPSHFEFEFSFFLAALLLCCIVSKP